MTLKAQSSAPTPRFTLGELAERSGGQAEGDCGFLLSGVAGLAEAGPLEVTFVEGVRQLPAAAAGCAGALFLPAGLELPGRNLIRVGNPRLAFAETLALFHRTQHPPAGIHPSAVVEPGAVVDPSASVAAFCFVGAGARIGARAVLHPFVHVGPETEIGAETLLYPGVIVRERVSLGARVIVHSGAVIGSDGFGYVFDGKGHRKIPQVGTVAIGDDVEIGAGTTVDRATTGTTRIGRGTKIDNLVQVAHNVTIGEHVIIVSQSGIAGSASIGDGAVLGGRVALTEHMRIGAGARIAARSSVFHDVEAGTVVAGFGPQRHRDFMKSQAIFEQLPDLRRRLAEVEKRLAAAEAAAEIPKDKGR
ncbi:MAG: UDP-3-O-(3-hydroxymyristoyl)glucosamine N-acyltransferase [Candidatus Methylomirabilia bacterium]